MNKTPPRLPVQTVGRIADILEILARAGNAGRPLGDVARTMQLRPGTVHNLLKSLRLTGLVEQTPEGRYRLGWKLFSLCRSRLLDLPPTSPVFAALEEAASEVREALVLATLTAGRRRVIARVEVRRTVKVDLDQVEADSKPFWALVTSRVLAAFCDEAERDMVIANQGLPAPDAWQAGASSGGLLRALEQVRTAGFAEESEGDVASLAVPILDSAGRLLAALGTFLPVYRYAERREILLRQLRNTADRIGRLFSRDTAGTVPAKGLRPREAPANTTPGPHDVPHPA